MESLGLHSIRGRDKNTQKAIFKNALTQCTYMCLMNTFYTSPRRTDRSTIVLQCSLKSSTLTPKNIFLAGYLSSRPPGSLHRTGLTDRSQPIRSSASSADPADFELVSQQCIWTTRCTRIFSAHKRPPESIKLIQHTLISTLRAQYERIASTDDAAEYSKAVVYYIDGRNKWNGYTMEV